MIPETSIRLRCNNALASGWSLALCKKPDNTTIEQFFDVEQPQLKKLDLTKVREHTFVFAPYGSGNLAYAFIPDYHFSNDDVIRALDSKLTDVMHDTTDVKWYNTAVPKRISTQEHYVNYVQQTIQAITSKKLIKSVAARNALLHLPETFDVLTHFFLLCKQHPHAYVYLFSTPEAGTWLGVTPELLLAAEKDTLKTVALAGTKSVDDVNAWTEKEKEEHHYVEAFIDDVWEQLKIAPINVSEITDITAGNLKHLYSTFEWRTNRAELEKKFAKVLALLNPTPAVCGLPPIDSSLFIAEHEHMERRFYSGFSGVLNAPDSGTTLYVTLRCMEYFNTKAVLYAGAGITKDSQPEKEWLETERKIQTQGLN